jgi:outer membrane protein
MRNKYDEKQEALKKEVDSLAAPFQKLYDEYMEKRESMSDSERQQKEQQLRQMQQQIRAKQNQQGQQIQQQRKEEADSLINVMEDKIAEYAKQNGYTYVFGSNQSSNILYGEKSKNVTDDVIEVLNEDQSEDEEETDEEKTEEEKEE